MFEAVWPKHKQKIQLVMKHIERHTSLMRNEVRLEHIRTEHQARIQALEHFERSEKADRSQEYHSIRTFINPKGYEDTFDRIRGRVYPDTGAWLLRDKTFSQWLKASASNRIFWLKGIPGAGKTYLASSVVHEVSLLHRAATPFVPNIYAFLKYTQSDTTSALSVVLSLTFQLTPNREDLQLVLCQSSRENIKSSLDAATRLLIMLLGCAGPSYIAIDGLDEIEETERRRLAQKLLQVCQECKTVNILISSRDEGDLSSILKGKTAEIQVHHHNTGSIQAYVDHRKEEWFAEREFFADTQSEITNLLTTLGPKAKGAFIFYPQIW